MTNDAPPKVRTASAADIPQILELGKLLFKENAISDWSETQIMKMVHKAVAGEGSVIGVIGPIGQLQGMIHLFVARFWYTDEAHLEEIYSYVHPEYRKSNNAKALIEFAKTAAENIKTPLLIGILSNDRTEQKIRLYQRRLGKPSGAYWLWNSKTGK